MAEQSRKIDFQIEGITCGGCAMDMESVLMDKDGILTVAASYPAGTLVVEYDAAQVTEEEIIRLVDTLGLKITRVSIAT